jgi:hypothetical protein
MQNLNQEIKNYCIFSDGTFTVFPIFSNPRGSIKFMNLLNIDGDGGEGRGECLPSLLRIIQIYVILYHIDTMLWYVLP